MGLYGLFCSSGNKYREAAPQISWIWIQSVVLQVLQVLQLASDVKGRRFLFPEFHVEWAASMTSQVYLEAALQFLQSLLSHQFIQFIPKCL